MTETSASAKQQLHPTVAESARLCLLSFNQFLRIAESIHPRELSLVEDQLGRFSIWMTNIRVFAPGRASLDHRLREAPDVQDIVIGLLDALAFRVQSCSNNLIPLSSGIAEKSSQPLIEVDPKFRESIQGISNEISLLHRFSNTIRRASKATQDIKAADSFRIRDEEGNDIEDFLANVFVNQIRDKFPGASDTIHKRLAETMVLRRKRILYRRSRYGNTPIKTQQPSSEPRLVVPEVRLKIRATGQPQVYEGHHIAKNASKSTIHSIARSATTLAPSDFQKASAPSIVSTLKTIPLGGHEELPFPPAPLGSLKQKYKEFRRQREERGDIPDSTQSRDKTESHNPAWNENSEVVEEIIKAVGEVACPFCFYALPAGEVIDGKKWRLHVKNDLDAFLNHMREHATRWRCTSKPHMGLAYESRDDYIAHMRTAHKGKFSEAQLQVLADRNGRVLGPLFRSCPLCGKKEAGDTMDNHIVHHLRFLALKSLPIYEDEDDEQEDDESQKGSSNALRAESRGSTVKGELAKPSLGTFHDIGETDGENWRTFLWGIPELRSEYASYGGFRSYISKYHTQPEGSLTNRESHSSTMSSTTFLPPADNEELLFNHFADPSFQFVEMSLFDGVSDTERREFEWGFIHKIFIEPDDSPKNPPDAQNEADFSDSYYSGTISTTYTQLARIHNDSPVAIGEDGSNAPSPATTGQDNTTDQEPFVPTRMPDIVASQDEYAPKSAARHIPTVDDDPDSQNQRPKPPLPSIDIHQKTIQSPASVLPKVTHGEIKENNTNKGVADIDTEQKKAEADTNQARTKGKELDTMSSGTEQLDRGQAPQGEGRQMATEKETHSHGAEAKTYDPIPDTQYIASEMVQSSGQTPEQFEHMHNSIPKLETDLKNLYLSKKKVGYKTNLSFPTADALTGSSHPGRAAIACERCKTMKLPCSRIQDSRPEKCTNCMEVKQDCVFPPFTLPPYQPIPEESPQGSSNSALSSSSQSVPSEAEPGDNNTRPGSPQNASDLDTSQDKDKPQITSDGLDSGIISEIIRTGNRLSNIEWDIIDRENLRLHATIPRSLRVNGQYIPIRITIHISQTYSQTETPNLHIHKTADMPNETYSILNETIKYLMSQRWEHHSLDVALTYLTSWAFREEAPEIFYDDKPETNLHARFSRLMDLSCAICGAPASLECGCEAKALEIAIEQAEARMMSLVRSDIGAWVGRHAREFVIENFAEDTRGYQENDEKTPSEGENGYQIMEDHMPPTKERRNASWMPEFPLYPETFDYFYHLVEVTIPPDDDPAVKDPPLSVLSGVRTAPRAKQRGQETRALLPTQHQAVEEASPVPVVDSKQKPRRHSQ